MAAGSVGGPRPRKRTPPRLPVLRSTPLRQHTTAALSLSNLWVLMVSAFVDMIGFALIVPLLPLYADRFGADPFMIGILMGAFAFGQMATAPQWGRLSDRFGRKPVLITSQAVSAIAFAVFAFANSVELLLFCRLLQGVGAGSLGAVSAYVSDAVRPEQRTEALGWITACTSAGVMVGPAIGSLTVRLSYSAPGLIAASFCLVNIVFTSFFLHEAKAAGAAAAQKPKAAVGQQILAVLRQPAATVHGLIWIYTAGMMAFMALTGIMALYLNEQFGITEDNIGWFYVGVGFISVIMRGLILGRMVRAFGEVRVLRAGALCLGVGLLGMTFTSTPLQFALMMLFVPTGTALLFPSTTSLVTRYADPDHVGQTVGVQQAFGSISRLLAPMWAGAAYQYLGPHRPFWIAGVLVLATAALSLRLRPGEAPQRGDGPSAEPENAETELAAAAGETPRERKPR
ncbi:MAG: MFS transporter [Acidobacteriota bacterium]